MLARLLEAGMNVARFNMAHGTYEYHSAMIEKLRQASGTTGIPVALLIDIKGPEIRTGNVEGAGTIELRTGTEVSVVVDDTPCTADRLSISYHDLPDQAVAGQHILIADGLIDLEVLRVEGRADEMRGAHRRDHGAPQEREHHRHQEPPARRHGEGRGKPSLRGAGRHGFRGRLLRAQAGRHPGDPPDPDRRGLAHAHHRQDRGPGGGLEHRRDHPRLRRDHDRPRRPRRAAPHGGNPPRAEADHPQVP